MTSDTVIKSQKNDCTYEIKGYCDAVEKQGNKKVVLDQCQNCDFRDIPFSQHAIHKTIRKEKLSIARMYTFTRIRKKAEIQDKVYGLYKLYEILEKEFGEPNPIKAQLSDPEFVKEALRAIR
jgi:hypothetical protein